jgi:hypothetical protein
MWTSESELDAATLALSQFSVHFSSWRSDISSPEGT